VTLADGTKIDKQIADFNDKDTAKSDAASKLTFNSNIEEMDDQERELYKLSNPIPLTNLMVNRPCCMILVIFAIILIISVFVFAMEWLNPQNPTDRDYMVWGDPYVTNFDKSFLVSSALVTIEAGEEAPLQS